MSTKEQFTEVPITSWDAIHDLATNSLVKWVFRGHSDAKWTLSSSLVRECQRMPVAEDYWISVEYRMLREFKRRAHLYERNLPDHNDHVSWLAFMQHYGAPTRLVDFTYSLYVACFFALIASDGDAAVWAIDDSWLRYEGTTDVPEARWGLREEELRGQYKAANDFLSAIHEENKGGGRQYKKITPGVFMLEPERQTERLGNQQGLFLMQRDIHRSFLENLASNSVLPESAAKGEKQSPAKHIRKLILHNDLRSRGLGVLRAMNVTAESLFPGIEGYSKAVLHNVLGA
jgi:FRG domain